jgi:hypothetical protein
MTIEKRIDKVLAGLKNKGIDVSAHETQEGRSALIYSELAHNAVTSLVTVIPYLRSPLYTIYKTMLR